jgi:hypothetical protein
LIAPGVIGVAFAVNALQTGANADAAALWLTAAVVGSLGSELLAVLAYPPPRPA